MNEKHSETSLDLSIVVPLYNEQDSVAPLYAAIQDALSSLSLKGGAEVRFEFSDRTSPGKLLFGEDFCYVVMPIAVEG